MGQWVLHPDGSWSWDRTPADPSVTRIMSAYAGGSPMADYRDSDPRSERRPVPREIYDPELGSDGGGRYADPEPMPAIDPDRPVQHVDQLHYDEGPTSYRIPETPVGFERPQGPQSPGTWATPTADLVCCPTCGTGVNPDRLRD